MTIITLGILVFWMKTESFNRVKIALKKFDDKFSFY